MDGIIDGLKAIQALFSAMGSVVYYLWFILLPPILFYIFKILWMDFVWGSYASKVKCTVLEIIPPRDIEKSPLPMELVFETLSSTDKGLNVRDEIMVGELIPKFSFEIASEGGGVHFYVRTETRFRNIVESALYAQYPDIQILEVPDYVEQIPPGVPNKEYDLWSADFEFNKPDEFPIRTYRSFQEDVTGKMIDPLAHLIEIMGKAPAGHRLWFQCIASAIRPHWYSSAKKFVNELMGQMAKEKGVSADDSDALEMKLTPTEKKVLEAIEQNIGKAMFRTRLRFVYIAPTGKMDRATFISGFIGALKQFNDSNLNGFKPNSESKTYADYVFTKSRLRYRQRRQINRYKERDMDPYSTTAIMSSAELATLYHIPDMSVITPSLARVGAKKGSAPANLPVE